MLWLGSAGLTHLYKVNRQGRPKLDAIQFLLSTAWLYAVLFRIPAVSYCTFSLCSCGYKLWQKLWLGLRENLELISQCSKYEGKMFLRYKWFNKKANRKRSLLPLWTPGYVFPNHIPIFKKVILQKYLSRGVIKLWKSQLEIRAIRQLGKQLGFFNESEIEILEGSETHHLNLVLPEVVHLTF